MLDKRWIKFILLFIFLAEAISFFVFIVPAFRQVAFFIFLLLFLFISLKSFKLGVLLVLAELFIGSKGYLFYFSAGGLMVSLRIALWIIIISLWAGRILTDFLSARFSGARPKKIEFPKLYFTYFLLLFIFIFLGLLNGFLNKNNFANIFFDVNNWLYLFLFFPVFSALKSEEDFKALANIFFACSIWLALKTFFLLFAFSHFSSSALIVLYQWVRSSGIGEITKMDFGFYRIFFQSHIFVLIAFIITEFALVGYLKKKSIPQLFKEKNFYLFFISLSLFLAVIIISLSRSFWFGLALALIFFFLLSAFKGIKAKKYFFNFSVLAAVFLTAFIIISLIVKFPYPGPIGHFNPGKTLAGRSRQIKGEAAASSRWNLLPKLMKKISQSFILGQGFGTTVTYHSNDPRVLEENPGGEYTTYAFEWGWLDIWLKIGFLGLIAYLFFLAKMVINLLGSKSWMGFGLGATLFALFALNIFTPYLNHPLGIGFIILVAVILERKPLLYFSE